MVEKVDVLLVGAGVMSATLATLLSQLDPSLKMVMIERLDSVAKESSDAWNNAGTGHAGYCELNYTPQHENGHIPISRALTVNAGFEISLQFWSWLVEQGLLAAPDQFIRATPHLSFAQGEADVAFLRQRHALLSQHHLFKDMLYSEDIGQLREWIPMVMEQRDSRQPVAATRVAYGTDVDFGALTRGMVDALLKQQQFSLHTACQVKQLSRRSDGRWHVIVDCTNGQQRCIDAGFVFLGAGGAALPLLQKSGITEGRGYGAFPVSGHWLVCHNSDIIHQHRAKVYGKAPLGAPPMSLPHLDTRVINGESALMFGPFASFTTKFLKQGSRFDLFGSIRRDNLFSMLGAGLCNMDLTRYLITEAFQSHSQRMDHLRKFVPAAIDDQWTLVNAGQRVQIIRQGKLEFGTEIVSSADGSMAALLGASPGASISVSAMLTVIERCFRRQDSAWLTRMKTMLPSSHNELIENAALLKTSRTEVLARLGLLSTN